MATLTSVPLNAGRRRVFGSVFPPASLEARPPLTSTLYDQNPPASFQSHASSSTIKTEQHSQSFTSPHEQSTDVSPDRESWDQAWTATTAFLSVPDRGFDPIYESRETDGSEALKKWNRLSPPSKETGEALAYLTTAAQQASTIPGMAVPKDLFDWYGEEIRRHFLTNLRGGLYEVGLYRGILFQHNTDELYSFSKALRKRVCCGQLLTVCILLVGFILRRSFTMYCLCSIHLNKAEFCHNCCGGSIRWSLTPYLGHRSQGFWPGKLGKMHSSSWVSTPWSKIPPRKSSARTKWRLTGTTLSPTMNGSRKVRKREHE